LLRPGLSVAASAPVNGQVSPAGGRMLGTGTCIALIAIGAGVLGLLLSLLVWGPLNPARRRRAASAATARPPAAAEQRRVYQDDRPL
jgi:hypothetical protein